jgi:hypothetical protein
MHMRIVVRTRLHRLAALIVAAVGAAALAVATVPSSADAYETPEPVIPNKVIIQKVTEGAPIKVWERVDCNTRFNGWGAARRAGQRLGEEAPEKEECKVDIDINESSALRGHDYLANMSRDPWLGSSDLQAGRDDVWVSNTQVFQVDGMARKDRVREPVESFTVDLRITRRSGSAICVNDPNAAGCTTYHSWTRVRVDIKDSYIKSLGRARR